MPSVSVTTANIGTASTTAPNIRCASAVIQMKARAPTTGNSPYARLVSAACSRRRGSAIHDPSKQIPRALDRKSTRLNSSHSQISYAVFCLKKKKKISHQSYDIYENEMQRQWTRTDVSY